MCRGNAKIATKPLWGEQWSFGKWLGLPNLKSALQKQKPQTSGKRLWLKSNADTGDRLHEQVVQSQ